jgi:hypothetical protein
MRKVLGASTAQIVPSPRRCPMEQATQFWSATILAIVILLAIVPVYALFRIWRGRPRLGDEERSETGASPLTLLQRNAWLGVATLGAI